MSDGRSYDVVTAEMHEAIDEAPKALSGEALKQRALALYGSGNDKVLSARSARPAFVPWVGTGKSACRPWPASQLAR